MEIVQPIRDINQIHQIENILKSENMRDYMLFKIGIHSGLRVSDILELKVKDIKEQSHFDLKEKKTGKSKIMKIQSSLIKELKDYIKNMNDEDYLIKSQKGINKPISRIQAYRILNDVARRVGINSEIGTHTLRKTFGFWHYQLYNNIVYLQKTFNHSTSEITLRYIGILQDELDDMVEGLDYNKITNDIKRKHKKAM